MAIGVQLLCHFSPPIQGLSPYGDALAAAIEAQGQIALTRVGYRSAFPSLLHPGVGGASPADEGLHWARPASWRRIARQPAALLHIQHWQPVLASYLLPLVRMARGAGKRVIVTVHNTAPHEAVPGIGWIEDRLLRAADVLVVHDLRGQERLRARLGPRPDIRVIPHGVAVGPLAGSTATATPPFGLDPMRRRICLFGNLRGYKGVPALLEAWRRIEGRHPEVDLVIAGRLWAGGGMVSRGIARVLGSAQEASRIRRGLADPAIRDRVVLQEGFVPDADIDALLATSELAVFPYERFAGQSGAATRAAGAGCPVLVSDVAGLPMLAMAEDWIVPPGDVGRLAEQLSTHLASGVARNLRAAQRARVDAFRWEAVAGLHAELYASLPPR